MGSVGVSFYLGSKPPFLSGVCLHWRRILFDFWVDTKKKTWELDTEFLQGRFTDKIMAWSM